MTDLTEEQRRWVDGLRAMLDFVEQRPEMVPRSGNKFYVFANEASDFAQRALSLGNAEKSSTDTWYNVDRSFGPHTLQVTIEREKVCERVVVGTVEEEIEAPDPEAVEALPKVKQTVTTEKVEWRCPESLHSLLAS